MACADYALVYLPGAMLPASGEARLLYDLFGVPAFWLLALPIPVVLAVAMLRHHLFDVEIIISVTLVYGILTATMASLFELLERRIDAIVDGLFFRQDDAG